MLTLYEFSLSGNCYKVQLMLSLLGLEYKSVPINVMEREQKTPEFLALNPFGQVPVLKDDDIILRDSQAILVYLAKAYGNASWYPGNPLKAAEINAWLSAAANEIVRGPSALRAHFKMGRAINVAEAIAITNNLLTILEDHLNGREWLAGDGVSIADVAIYPYVALSHEGRVDLLPYPHLGKWLARFEKLDGFIAMEGIRLQ